MNVLHRRARPLPFTGRIFLPLAFLVLAALSTLWALASPLMAVPDEPAHAIKAASVVRGELLGVSGGEQGDRATVQVPGYIASLPAQACHAYDGRITADCAPVVDADDTALTAAETSAGNYNPMYYFLVGWPSLFMSGAPAVYAMRIVSGLIGAAFLAVSLGAAARLRRPRWPMAAAIVSITPMVLFLNGSINPNALEIVTTAALFLNLCVVLENSAALRLVRSNIVLVGVSGAVLANTRSLSLVWLALAVVVPLIMYGWKPMFAILRNRLGIAMTALIGVGCVLGLLWVLQADSLKSLTGRPVDLSRWDAAQIMLDRSFDYVSGYIGYMGWLDTPLPAGVYIFWHAAMGAVLLLGLAAPKRRDRLAILVLVAAAIALPPILQGQVIAQLGWIWQGRYLLAVIVLLLLACGVAFRTVPFPTGPVARRAGAWLLAGTAAAQLYAFIYVLRRYTVGLEESIRWAGMFKDTAWQPPFTWPVLVTLYALVLAAGAVLTHRALFRPTPDPAAAADADGGSGAENPVVSPPANAIPAAGVLAGSAGTAGRHRESGTEGR
ncbi:DUF2142 domain-containing protein [Arthrobacter sp. ZGTC212]|uniref:DUF2142 domain-containing protein n=1 Tax=Arthrobacter sp. ZGTC212 TaxID=2058899 RepID=UPI000CE2B6F3|nr:DUF2142 domain-containing protein [Arthrobacter sp. ZGTC212]